MKVVGIGLNRTGTTTLGVCMRHWGKRHLSCDPTAFRYLEEGNMEALLDVMEGYDSFEDWPWPLAYREIDERFPDSRFILTKRRTAEAWYESLCRHALKTGPTRYRLHVYGSEMPQPRREEHLRFYHEHNRKVEEYFRDRPGKLLTVCWEDGDGWEELARFLDLEVPDIPFPHANRSPSLFQRMLKRVRRFRKRLRN
ncbi:MAG: sulfotransferase family protein [Planctomycetota bacterium]